QYGLKVGVALTAEQMAQLTSDIVWLVEQTVTLPDGSTRQVLVPQVYVRVRPGDIDGHGALLSADATVIKGTGNLTNTGTLAGRTLVSINAGTVNNLSGGRITGGTVGIDARTDINNIGGVIQADAAAVLTAGRDINIQSTTRTTSSGVNLDRVAGLYVSNPDGVLIASAGRDVNLAAAVLSSGGSASVGAGRNVNLGTVTESSTAVALGQGVAGIAAQSRDIGSVVQAAGNLRLAAGNDLNIRASGVQSADGALVATAGHDINLTAGQASSMVATATVSHGGNALRRTSSSTFDASGQVDVLASSLAGNTVALVAGNDINAQAAQLYAEDAMSLSAGRDVNFTTATQTDIELHASQSRTSGTALGQAVAGLALTPGDVTAVAWAGKKTGANGASASITHTAVGSQVSAGSLQVVSGRDTTLTGATVVADGDITMLAGRNLTIESAQNTHLETNSQAGSTSGMVGAWYNPTIGHVKQFGAEAVARTTQAPSQVASLTGDVTLVAGNEYRQTASSVLAAGQAGELAGGDVNILARNVTINEAYDTEQTVGVSRSGSTLVGGSAHVAGLGTDTIRNGQSTIQAMGQTGDGRMQALGAMNLAMSGKQAYDAAQAVGSGGPYSYGVSVNVSRNESQANSFGTSTQAV
uniref:hemagglutinin repeat-containing protein n=1 Tax=Xenophilus azovorans TaxID=151755 RepID=UPI001B801E12